MDYWTVCLEQIGLFKRSRDAEYSTEHFEFPHSLFLVDRKRANVKVEETCSFSFRVLPEIGFSCVYEESDPAKYS